MAFVVVQFILLAAVVAAVSRPAGPVLFDGNTVTWFAGWALVGTGVVVVTAGFISLGRAVAVSPHPLPRANLVDRGIYRWLRHPMYTSAVLALTGMFLLRPRVAVLAASVVTIAYYLVKERYEEARLLERYPGYADYRRRTRGVLLNRGR